MGKVILAATSKSSVILAAPAKSGGSSAYLLIGLVVLFGILYFVTIRPQRRRQQQAQQTQRDVVPGSRVRTTSGMYATVVSLEDQDVILEVAPGVEARFMRRAIMDVVPDGTPTDYAEPDYSAEPEDSGDDEPEDSAETYGEAEDDAATG
jgi:preprotein translocase subunit YajC